MLEDAILLLVAMLLLCDVNHAHRPFLMENKLLMACDLCQNYAP